MRSLIPGRFASAIVRIEEGELEAQLSEGGSWQVRVRSGEESGWRLLCTGDLAGRVLAPVPREEETQLAIGPIAINFAARRVIVGDVEQSLTSREFDLLAMLASEPHRLFTTQELLREVWGYPAGCHTRTLRNHVSRIRCKLRRAGAEGFIVNYQALGYKFCESVPVASPASDHSRPSAATGTGI